MWGLDFGQEKDPSSPGDGLSESMVPSRHLERSGGGGARPGRRGAWPGGGRGGAPRADRVPGDRGGGALQAGEGEGGRGGVGGRPPQVVEGGLVGLLQSRAHPYRE